MEGVLPLCKGAVGVFYIPADWARMSISKRSNKGRKYEKKEKYKVAEDELKVEEKKVYEMKQKKN